jgi:aryl-alcohol dehydrogenase-like predicted oxidoreductase
MSYMRRGNSGLIVSALAFGAMTLGSPLAGASVVQIAPAWLLSKPVVGSIHPRRE